jgi:hypothetical protein
MSDREKPLLHQISLRALHFASELARYSRHFDEAKEAISESEWRPYHESDREFQRRIAGYLREERLRYLGGGGYLAHEFGGGDAPATPRSWPVHIPVRFFEDEQTRLRPPRERDPADDGH